MKSFERHRGRAAILDGDDIDTDVIIPLARLMATPRPELGRWAFEPLRYHEDGTPRPGFVLDDPAHHGASILVCGRNFGSGSSREGAVQAIDGLGVRVLVAESFGDIFASNCVKNGLLPVALPAPDLAQVADAVRSAGPHAAFEVDLEALKITGPELGIEFTLDPGARARLLSGRDEIALTLELDDLIRDFQARDRFARPWVWTPRTVPTEHRQEGHRP